MLTGNIGHNEDAYDNMSYLNLQILMITNMLCSKLYGLCNLV